MNTCVHTAQCVLEAAIAFIHFSVSFAVQHIKEKIMHMTVVMNELSTVHVHVCLFLLLFLSKDFKRDYRLTCTSTVCTCSLILVICLCWSNGLSNN